MNASRENDKNVPSLLASGGKTLPFHPSLPVQLRHDIPPTPPLEPPLMQQPGLYMRGFEYCPVARDQQDNGRLIWMEKAAPGIESVNNMIFVNGERGIPRFGRE